MSYDLEALIYLQRYYCDSYANFRYDIFTFSTNADIIFTSTTRCICIQQSRVRDVKHRGSAKLPLI